jgi:hypothetical protein
LFDHHQAPRFGLSTTCISSWPTTCDPLANSFAFPCLLRRRTGHVIRWHEHHSSLSLVLLHRWKALACTPTCIPNPLWSTLAATTVPRLAGCSWRRSERDHMHVFGKKLGQALLQPLSLSNLCQGLLHDSSPSQTPFWQAPRLALAPFFSHLPWVHGWHAQILERAPLIKSLRHQPPLIVASHIRTHSRPCFLPIGRARPRSGCRRGIEHVASVRSSSSL